MISIIAAMAKNRVIGYKGEIPWHLPADFAHFKKTTMGKPIIMGRVTYESIGRPLPGRTNIVITRGGKDFDGCAVATSLEGAIQLGLNESDEVFICGGAKIYEQALPLADRLIISHVEVESEGDAYFPEIDASTWSGASRDFHPSDEKNTHTFVVVEYVRK